jgi:hypothetical protein
MHPEPVLHTRAMAKDEQLPTMLVFDRDENRLHATWSKSMKSLMVTVGPPDPPGRADQSFWRERAAKAASGETTATFVATQSDRFVGVIDGFLSEDGHTVEVGGMWVLFSVERASGGDSSRPFPLGHAGEVRSELGYGSDGRTGQRVYFTNVKDSR